MRSLFQAPLLIMMTCCCLATGCNLVPRVPDLFPAAATEPVNQIVAMWQFSEHDNGNGTRQIGFAGQLLFLGAGDPVPRPVSNKVTILVYEQEDARWVLRKQFKHSPDAWASHQRKTALGTVYNVFVPHDTMRVADLPFALRIQHIDDAGQELLSDLVVLQ